MKKNKKAYKPSKIEKKNNLRKLKAKSLKSTENMKNKIRIRIWIFIQLLMII